MDASLAPVQKETSKSDVKLHRRTSLSKANSSFALDLFEVLADKNKTSNVFFSPFSISSALSMVLLGARGDTATQITQCLKMKDCEDVHSSFSSLLQQLNRPYTPYALSVANRLYGEKSHQFLKCLKMKDCEDVHSSFSSRLLSVANRLYGEQSCQFLENFLEGTRTHYSSELETVDFVNKAEKSRVHINTWVEEQTQGKIADLLAVGVVNSMTKLVLVNAIYFKAKWVKTFKREKTRDTEFKLNKKDTKTVKMMHQYSRFSLRQIKEISCQVIELPYVGRQLSMLIILPDDIEDSTTGLEKLEQLLTYDNFVEWTRRDKMSEYDVDLALPRFRVEACYALKNILCSMGMEDAFDPSKCDFSGMSPSKELVLTEVVHKTFVDVNEEDTEAAAATAHSMVIGCAAYCPVPQATFIADHPFLFFIRHNDTNTVLFAGRYCS